MDPKRATDFDQTMKPRTLIGFPPNRSFVPGAHVSKLFAGLFLMIIASALFCGCGKSSSASNVSAPAVASDPVDTTQLRKEFAEATPGIKVYLDEIFTLVRTGNFAEAVEHLQKLSANPTLSAAQKAAVTEMIGKVQNLAAGKSPA